MKCAIQTLKVLLVRKVVSWVTFQTCQIITLWGGDRPDLPSWDSIWRDSKINISYTKDLQSCHFHFLFSWFLLDRPLCKNAVQADSYLNSASIKSAAVAACGVQRLAVQTSVCCRRPVFPSRCAEILKVRNTNLDTWTFNGLQRNLLVIHTCPTSCLPTCACL